MTDDLERELSSLLRDRAAHAPAFVDPPSDLDARVGRARTRRTARFAAMGVAALALVAGTVGVVAASDRNDGVQVGDDPSASTVPVTEPAPPTTGAVTVAAYADGHIAEISPTGEELRVLVEDAFAAGQAVDNLVVDRDGDLWYRVYQPALTSACGNVVHVDDGVVTGRHEYVDAASFAIGPNGERMVAFANSCSDWDQGSRIEMLSAEGAVLRQWESNGVLPTNLPLGMAWSPDGGTVAIAFCWEDCIVALQDVGSAESPWEQLDDQIVIAGDQAMAWMGSSLFTHWVSHNPEEDVVRRIEVHLPAVVSGEDLPYSWGEHVPLSLAAVDGSLLAVVRDADVTMGLYRWDFSGDPVLVDGRVVAVGGGNPIGP